MTRREIGANRRTMVLALLLTVVIVSANGDRPDSQIDQWMETLRFGIDSEVESILTPIRQAGVTELDDALATRFSATRSNALRKAIIEHFTELDSAVIGTRVRSLLVDEEGLPNDLLRVSAAYLSRVAGEESDALIDRYREIALRADTLSATVAIDAIGRSRTENAEKILIALYDEVRDVDRRAAVVRALGTVGARDAIDLLTRLATDEFESASLRHYAAESLGRIGSPDSLPVLSSLLSDPDAVMRAYATLALGFYPQGDSSHTLQDALLDSFWRVRVAALQGIAEQKDPEAIPAVSYKARRDPERPVREQAITTLLAIGTDRALDTIAAIASDRRAAERERITAVTGLIERTADASIETVTRIVAEEWSLPNSRLLDAIGRAISVRSEAAFEPLATRFLQHENFIIRIYGMRAIGKAGLSEHADELRRIARANPPGLVRTTAVSALGELGIDFDPEAAAESPDSDPDETAPAEAGGSGASPDDRPAAAADDAGPSDDWD
ncbi:MAG: hypothetical protein EA382_06625 [Spirochaetaceae bacterium]|nr:MAG: hypothetical protein EA382_06625 [Spirochaetaceae bacterium]